MTNNRSFEYFSNLFQIFGSPFLWTCNFFVLAFSALWAGTTACSSSPSPTLCSIRVPISMVSHWFDLIFTTNYWSQVRDRMTNWVFYVFFRCPPDNDLGFPHFAATAQGTGPGGLSSMTSYLKTAPYIMTVDSLHSMGYPTPGKYHSFLRTCFGLWY